MLKGLFGKDSGYSTRPQIEFEDDWRIIVINKNYTRELRIEPVEDDVGVYVANNYVQRDIQVPKRMWERGQVTLENNLYRELVTYTPEDDASDL